VGEVLTAAAGDLPVMERWGAATLPAGVALAGPPVLALKDVNCVKSTGTIQATSRARTQQVLHNHHVQSV
jgi:hypothetical protein